MFTEHQYKQNVQKNYNPKNICSVILFHVEGISPLKQTTPLAQLSETKCPKNKMS